jgi:hypoxanthine phosphoribosyltransferase
VSEALVASLLERCTFAESSSLELACSGGADSTALAVLAAATGRDVRLHHVDHQLRAGSAEEAVVVKELARRLGASFEAHVAELDAGGNLEARSRLARRALLPADVATGHTMDDQAETVLLNLARGAGLDGIAAMAPGGRHPLLALRRAETRVLCAELGLAVVEDPSNEDPAFARNRVRHELLPLLADIARRDPVPLLARAASTSRADVALLDELAQLVVVDPADVAALRSAPGPLSDRALRAWVRSARSAGGDSHPPSAAEIDRLRAVVDGRAVATELSGGLRVARRQGRLRLTSGPSGNLAAVGGAPERDEAPPWAAHDLGEVVVSAEQIQQRVAELGEAITGDYAEDAPLLVGVLKGAMHFISDLAQAIELPIDVDFMAVSSYGTATKTSGIVRIVKDLDVDLSGRHVLVVEDIIDSGLTLNYLRKYLGARGAASIEVCALLVKEGALKVSQELRYIGFEIEPSFVVGYGLDVAERYRNLDAIYSYVGAQEG